MNQVNVGESSSGLSVYPAKQRRGRPRKDPNLKHAGAAHLQPGFQRAKQYLPRRADRTEGSNFMVGQAKQYLPGKADRTEGSNSMVGQAVTGVVEATFDAGYLLTVRIGGSTTNLKGVVYKPGHYVPVTAENDVAPHLQMIRRKDIRFPAENQGQKLAIQAPGTMPSKRRHVSPKTAPSVPPVGVRGTVVPVVLQPVNFPNGSSQMHSDTSQSTHFMAFGDKDVHMVEPLAMLPPNRSLPVGQIFPEQNDSRPFNEGSGELGQGGNVKSMGSSNADNSSDTSDNQTDNDKEEALKSSEANSFIALKQDTGNTNKPISTEFLQTGPVTKPSLFSFGAGRMTELLQAVQENMKENQAHIAERPLAAPKVEFHPNDNRN